jgi:hypothetical protein
MSAIATTLLTEEDVNAYDRQQLPVSILTAGNRCQTDDCLQTKVEAAVLNRKNNVWQAFVLHRYLRIVEMQARPRLIVGYVLLVQWRDGGGWRCASRLPSSADDNGDDNDDSPLYVLHVELLSAKRHATEYQNAVLVYRNRTAVVLPFDPDSVAALETVPWEGVFRTRKPIDINIQSADRPWVSLLWLHVALSAYPGVDVVGSLRQNFNADRTTAVFELFVVDELIPPLQSVDELHSAHLTPFEDQRIHRLDDIYPLREILIRRPSASTTTSQKNP